MRTYFRSVATASICVLSALSFIVLQAQPIQTFSNSGPASFGDGLTGSINIPVSGVGVMGFDYGITAVFLDVSAVNVSLLTIELSGPGGNTILLADGSFPNGGSGLLDTELSDCLSLDDVDVTNDNAPYTGSYHPLDDFDVFNNDVLSADDTWTLSVYSGPGTPFGSLDGWTIEFNRKAPDIAFPTFIDPTCPGDDDGVIICNVIQNSYCDPQTYTIRIDGILFEQPDSTFTGLTGSPVYTNVRAVNGNGNAYFFPGPFTLDDSDFDPPFFSDCPPDITANSSLNNPGDCAANLGTTDPFIFDDCDSDPALSVDFLFPDASTMSFGGVPGMTFFMDFPVGTTEITYTATDASGNTETCIQYVDVFDDELPSFVDCPADITLGTSSEPGVCSGEVMITDPTPDDNCDIVDYTITYEFNDGSMSGPFDGDPGNTFTISFQVGTNFATYVVEDEGGNTAECVQIITVVDDEAPAWDDPSLMSTITGTCGVDIAADLLAANLPTGTDDCGTATAQVISSISGLDCGGGNASSAIYTLELIDESGNINPDNFEVSVILEDVDPPVFSGIPANVTINCLNPLPPDPVVTANDVCDGPITVDLNLVDDITGVCIGGGIVATYTYNYSATDACGNVATASYVVSVSNGLVADLGPDVLVCGGDQAMLDASDPGVPDASYLWSTGATTPAITVGAGSYSVTITTPAGCCAFDDIEVIEDTPPDASAAGGTLDCTGSAITIMGMSATPNVMFAWTGPGGFMSNLQNPMVSQAGTYTLTVTSILGCTATAEAVVQANLDVPDANATGGTIDCNNASVQLMGSSVTPGVTYSWSGPGGFISSEQNPTVTMPGTYTLTVMAPNACVAMATAMVVDDTTGPILSATADTLTCTSTSATIQLMSDPASTYLWSGPGGFSSGDQNPTVTMAGAYTVTATAGNGCSNELSISVVSDIENPDASATGDTLTCGVSSIQIMGNSATPGVSYGWTGPAGFMSSLQNPSVSVAGTYTLTVTAPNGCTAQANAEVLADAEIPDVSASAGTITCAVPMTTLMGSSMTAGATYAWSGPGGFMSDNQNPSIGSPGTYTLTVTAPNGCTASLGVVVMANLTKPDANARLGDIDCLNGMIALEAVSATPGVSYNWTGPNGFSSDQQNTATNTQGSYILTVTGTNGCTRMDTVEVMNDLSPITALITADLVITGNDGVASIEVNGGEPPYIINWDNGETGTMAVMLTAGPHTVSVTDDNSCQRVFTFEMNRLETVCDIQAAYVSVGDQVTGLLGSSSVALPTVLDQTCVLDAYSLPLPDPLAMMSYLFYSQGAGLENVAVTLDAMAADNVRGFVFSCACDGFFCAQSCIGTFDNNTQFEFTGQEGYFYIVLLGNQGSEFTINMLDLSTPEPICPVDGIITCGGSLIETLSGEDDFNTINPDKNIYLDCYDGGSGFVGPDHVYRLDIAETSDVSMLAFSANARLGMFLYNHLCGENCIASREGAGIGSFLRMGVRLVPGVYYIVIDQAENPVGQEITLLVNCSEVDGDDDVAEIGFGFNSSNCPVDTFNKHTILFDLSSSVIGDMQLGNGDKIYMKRVDGKLARTRSFRYNGVDDIPVVVYEDDDQDPEYCGYRINDEFRITVDLKNGPVYNNVNVVYAPENGNTITAQGNFEREGQSLVTNINTSANSVGFNLAVSPASDSVLSNVLTTTFEVQANQDWDVFTTAGGWITMVGIDGGNPNVTSGSGTKRMVVQFAANPDCSPRKDTVRIQGKSSGQFKDFVIIQAGTSDLSEIVVTTNVNSDGTVTASAVGGMSPYTYLWSTGDMAATTADSLADGTYFVTVTDDDGCSVVQEVIVGTVSILDPSLGGHIKLSPNPTTGRVHLRFSLDREEDVRYTLYNSIGIEVASSDLRRIREAHEVLDIAGMASGLYLMEFRVGNRIYGTKLILQD